MSMTPNLQIPYLISNQASAEVTVNEAINRLEGVAQNGVIDKDLTAPPVGPNDGDLYIVAAAATGDWADEDGNLAMYYSGWVFVTPKEGMSFWVNDEDKFYVYDGAAWIESTSSVGGENVFRFMAGAGVFFVAVNFPQAFALDTDPVISVVPTWQTSFWIENVTKTGFEFHYGTQPAYDQAVHCQVFQG